MRGRFAPSPTGPLHFGSLVAAIASWLDARHARGEWLVRMEDIDETRTVPGAADDILRTLQAFGLAWDGAVEWQTRRKPLYEAALEKLRGAGLAYRCRCSRREIADSGLRGIEGAVYPGTCRHLAIGTPPEQSIRYRTPPLPPQPATDSVARHIPSTTERGLPLEVARAGCNTIETEPARRSP